MIGIKLTFERATMADKPKSVDGSVETRRFKDISFEDYGVRALDASLSENEKVGFPDAFRDGHSETIWKDLLQKLPSLHLQGSRILDIGCGCGHLPQALIQHAKLHDQKLTMIDHPNMLTQLREVEGHRLIGGRFPDVLALPNGLANERFDVIICYSVLQVASLAMNPFIFVDSAAELLASGGQLIFGDIPNFSKLRRFLASEIGRTFHRNYMQTELNPVIKPFEVDKSRLDDSMVLGIVAHLRMGGCHAYVLPQPTSLPLATRREDVLVVKP
jgi:2-polyprenyl-3-methyl-5-hydroxy-6-metoxy-1,4-benzoquinol methylase